VQRVRRALKAPQVHRAQPDLKVLLDLRGQPVLKDRSVSRALRVQSDLRDLRVPQDLQERVAA